MRDVCPVQRSSLQQVVGEDAFWTPVFTGVTEQGAAAAPGLDDDVLNLAFHTIYEVHELFAHLPALQRLQNRLQCR